MKYTANVSNDIDYLMLKENVIASFNTIIKLMAEIDYDAVKEGYSFNFRNMKDVERLKVTNPEKFKKLINLYQDYFKSFRKYINNIEDQQRLFLQQMVNKEIDPKHVETVKEAVEETYNQVDKDLLSMERKGIESAESLALESDSVNPLQISLNDFVEDTEDLLDRLDRALKKGPRSLEKIEDRIQFIAVMKLSQKLIPNL